MNQKVAHYLLDGCGRCKYYATPQCKVNTWRNELVELRKILHETPLTEEFKWKQPCYTFNGKNIAIMTAFKEYCALAFLKGSLLQDKFNLLKAPGEHSQAARQFRFTNVSEILELESTIKQYIDEAIKLEKAGAKIDFKAKTELEYPEELIGKLADDAGFKKAFEALTPGRKRAYVIFFSAPKQSSTRISRIEKSVPGILIGKGWNER